MTSFIDIGANLTDDMFQGVYNGRRVHEADLDLVLSRAASVNVNHMIVTAGLLEDSVTALSLCKQYSSLSTTIGIHPTRSRQVLSGNMDDYLSQMQSFFLENRSYISCIGELGLDYDRLKFSNKEEQHIVLNAQLQLFSQQDFLNVPLFLHSRNCTEDFLDVMFNYRSFFSNRNFVVHSFTDGVKDVKSFLSRGAFIGFNGCSMKTEQDIETVQETPVDKILLETDAPWCTIKPSHASFKFLNLKRDVVKREKFVRGKLVKDRCEPGQIVEVCEVVANVKGLLFQDVASTVYSNTTLFMNTQS
ncbi:hypothetical protein RCL1_001314 [Eukaryota sp. TZLM3-RCL]